MRRLTRKILEVLQYVLSSKLNFYSAFRNFGKEMSQFVCHTCSLRLLGFTTLSAFLKAKVGVINLRAPLRLVQCPAPKVGRGKHLFLPLFHIPHITSLSSYLSSFLCCIQLLYISASDLSLNKSQVWNVACCVFAAGHQVGTFQRLKALPASVWGVQCSGGTHCQSRRYSGLLRHDPQQSSHWNEGDRSSVLTWAQSASGGERQFIQRLGVVLSP